MKVWRKKKQNDERRGQSAKSPKAYSKPRVLMAKTKAIIWIRKHQKQLMKLTLDKHWSVHSAELRNDSIFGGIICWNDETECPAWIIPASCWRMFGVYVILRPDESTISSNAWKKKIGSFCQVLHQPRRRWKHKNCNFWAKHFVSQVAENLILPK